MRDLHELLEPEKAHRITVVVIDVARPLPRMTAAITPIHLAIGGQNCPAEAPLRRPAQVRQARLLTRGLGHRNDCGIGLAAFGHNSHHAVALPGHLRRKAAISLQQLSEQAILLQ